MDLYDSRILRELRVGCELVDAAGAQDPGLLLPVLQ